jgi:hypothetical protein
MPAHVKWEPFVLFLFFIACIDNFFWIFVSTKLFLCATNIANKIACSIPTCANDIHSLKKGRGGHGLFCVQMDEIYLYSACDKGFLICGHPFLVPYQSDPEGCVQNSK